MPYIHVDRRSLVEKLTKITGYCDCDLFLLAACFCTFAHVFFCLIARKSEADVFFMTEKVKGGFWVGYTDDFCQACSCRIRVYIRCVFRRQMHMHLQTCCNILQAQMKNHRHAGGFSFSVWLGVLFTLFPQFHIFHFFAAFTLQ